MTEQRGSEKVSDPAPPAVESGKTVLLVEDDWLQGSMLADLMQEAGFKVLGPVRDLREVRQVVGTKQVDLVLLDVNLGDGPDFAFAETLQEAGMPFAFVTAYDRRFIPSRFAGIERLEKPFHADALMRTIAPLLS